MKLLASFAIATAVASLALLPAARAGGTIDATQFMPLGQFNAWEMIDKAQWNGGVDPTLKAEPQIMSVSKAVVVNGIVRYSVKTKFFSGVADLILQIGVDQGVVYLFGAKIIDPEVDFDNGDLSVPIAIFDSPIPIGDTTTALDADFGTSPVTSKVDVSIDIGPKSFDGTVFITGTVTSRWNSVAPIDTPLGTLGGPGQELAELQLNCDFTYSSDDDDINDAVSDKHTVKGVSGVMGAGIGFVQIDGQGSQQKIVNRVVLPGELLSNPADPDAFPAPPPGDIAGFAVGTPDIAVLDGLTAGLADGGITDGVLTLTNVAFEQGLGGALDVTAQVASQGAGPVDLHLQGTAKMNPVTGGLKVKLSGKTKKLTDIVKPVVFSLNQELLPPFDGLGPLHLLWKAGKDPITKLPIGGTLDIPVAPFVATSASLVLNLPVDDPKVKKGFLSIGTASRGLGAEGVLTLGNATDGTGLDFPVFVKETVKIKEGLPAVRSYSLYQTGKSVKLFGWGATSTSAADYLLTKFSGKLLGVKILPLLADVEVSAQ
jgi:hypothetical protein